jgi:hypothetical protein
MKVSLSQQRHRAVFNPMSPEVRTVLTSQVKVD